MQIGDVIYLDESNLDWYKENVSDWCKSNNAMTVEIDPIDREVEEKYTVRENGELVEKTRSVTKTCRQFKIQAVPAPTEEEKAERKRAERNEFLDMTDKYMISDFPITDEEREKYKAYRTYLRDLPASDLFPNIDVLTFSQWNS